MNKIINILFFVFLFSFSIEAQFSQPFITVWKTDNSGQSESNQVQLPVILDPANSLPYSFNVTWQEVNNPANSGSYTYDKYNFPGLITFPSTGVYKLEITGDYPSFSFGNLYYGTANDAVKLVSLEQWGDLNFESLEGAFYGCKNLEYNAIDMPDLSKLTNKSLEGMFGGCKKFNGNISNWDVSTIENMSRMFEGASIFNGYINNWNVSSVTNMSNMFSGAQSFNEELFSWDVSKVTDMSGMFSYTLTFNSPIGYWNVANVINMSRMFEEALSFNQYLNSWNVGKALYMSSMFRFSLPGNSKFNGDISSWNVSNLISMDEMFWNASSFNQNIGSWNVSNVKSMRFTFAGATLFNQNLSKWDVSNVTDMYYTFASCSNFNQNLSQWNVKNVTNMQGMLSAARVFNQDISNWNVSKVNNMAGMFNYARAFNVNINKWDVSNVTNMNEMFDEANDFNQDISSWNISNVTTMRSMFLNSDLSSCNYNSILSGWSNQTLQNNVDFSAGTTKYSPLFENSRQLLIDNFKWKITDGGKATGATDTSIDNSISANGNILTATVTNLTYQWIDCSNNTPINGETMQSFTAQNPGNYAVEISSALGCMNISSCYEVKTASTLENEAFTGFSIYPNPAQNELFIDFNKQEKNEIDVKIFDLQGVKLIEHKSLLANGSIDIRNLPAGIYLLKVTENQSEYVNKFTKE